MLIEIIVVVKVILIIEAGALLLLRRILLEARMMLLPASRINVGSGVAVHVGIGSPVGTLRVRTALWVWLAWTRIRTGPRMTCCPRRWGLSYIRLLHRIGMLACGGTIRLSPCIATLVG